jgi:CheY-like chemotaxis protein
MGIHRDHIKTAYDGEPAVSIFKKQPKAFDIILMDLNMPTKDGYAAAKEIR